MRPEEDWVLDTDIDITDGHFVDGRLYLCQTCCLEIADIAGCLTPAMRERFVDERDVAIRQATELRDVVDRLTEANQALAAIRPVAITEPLRTPKYVCQDCIAAGVPTDEAGFQNPQGLGRHRSAKHGAKPPAVLRGDAALEEVDA